jgi:hypothetical protein
MRSGFGGLAPVVVLAMFGCDKGGSAPAPVLPRAVAPSARPAADPHKPYVLDGDKLDRYIKYHRTVIAASFDALRNIGQIGPDAGTVTTLVGVKGALGDQKDKMDAALKESGLTDADVTAIDPMVKDLSIQFTLGASFNQDALIEMLEKQAAQAPPQAKAQMEKSIAEMKAQKEARATLSVERKKWGDANVDVLVSRREQLVQMTNEGIAALGGKVPAAAK